MGKKRWTMPISPRKRVQQAYVTTLLHTLSEGRDLSAEASSAVVFPEWEMDAAPGNPAMHVLIVLCVVTLLRVA